jgi:hypothetical protein
MATFIEARAELARLDLRCMTASRFVPDAKGTARSLVPCHLTELNARVDMAGDTLTITTPLAGSRCHRKSFSLRSTAKTASP